MHKRVRVILLLMFVLAAAPVLHAAGGGKLKIDKRDYDTIYYQMQRQSFGPERDCRVYLALAEGGYGRANLGLARCYVEGKGFAADHPAAFAWLFRVRNVTIEGRDLLEQIFGATFRAPAGWEPGAFVFWSGMSETRRAGGRDRREEIPLAPFLRAERKYRRGPETLMVEAAANDFHLLDLVRQARRPEAQRDADAAATIKKGQITAVRLHGYDGMRGYDAARSEAMVCLRLGKKGTLLLTVRGNNKESATAVLDAFLAATDLARLSATLDAAPSSP